MVSRALTWSALALTLLFLALTAAIVLGWTSGVDLAVTRTLQSTNWGPLQFAFAVSDQWDGPRQVILALAVVTIVFALDHRLGVLALLCTGSGGAWFLLELLIARPRPDSHLVHVVRHASGASYPSGHAVYYVWALVMLALVSSARLPHRLRFLPWLGAALALAVVCVGRVVEGEHWPTDVAGGLLLGGAWVLALLAAGRSLLIRRAQKAAA